MVVEVRLLSELCNGLVLLEYLCEEYLSFIHNVWYIKDLGGNCFLELLDWHVVEILTFIHYTHMNKVTNLGRYLMSKVLFRSLSSVVFLELVRGFDYSWVVELKLINLDILGMFMTTVGRKDEEALIVKFNVILEAIYKLLRFMVPIRYLDYRVLILDSNFCYAIVVPVVEFVTHLVTYSG